MANELKHKTVGTSLTQVDFEDVALHVLDGQTADDIIYASSATQLSRLAMAASRIPAKLAAGTLVAATPAEIITLLGVSTIIWKDASESALTDSNRTATLNYTDLDLTATTSANAKFAILKMEMLLDSITPTAVGALMIRKNGTTPTYMPVISLDSLKGDTAGADSSTTCIIGLDAGQIIEYSIYISGTIQVDSYIRVLGYIE